MIIHAVEQAILDKANETCPDLSQTGSLPGNWTMDTLKKALQFAPGVYVSFLGGANTDYKNARINSQFDVYIVNKSAIEKFRREDRTGAYDLIESLVPALHKLQVNDVGTLNLKRVNNLFKESLFDLGGSVYALTFEIDLYFEDYQEPEFKSKVLDFSVNAETTVVVS